jgi:G3E family GTPase
MEAVASLPPSVFRVKGIVAFPDSQQTMLFQYVGGRWELSFFRDSGVHDCFLAVIGRGDVQAGIGPLEALAAKAYSREQFDGRR